jgi:hypothetical protein
MIMKPSMKNVMRSGSMPSSRSNRQLRTFRVYFSLAPSVLRHLSVEAGLDQAHYNNVAKRAAGLTVCFYKDAAEGLTPSVKLHLNSFFK